MIFSKQMWEQQASSSYEYAKSQVMQHNPESKVIDDIDRLVNESLEREMYCECDDRLECTCDCPSDDIPKCELCKRDWHGLDYDGCPGAFATDDEKQAWWVEVGRQMARQPRALLPPLVTFESNDSEVVAEQILSAATQLMLYGEVYYRREGDSWVVMPHANAGVGEEDSGCDIVQFDEVRDWFDESSNT